MARIRTLKPEFWTDDIIVELTFAARLFYQGYWNFALCDYGHSDATPKSLKMKIFPADDVDAEELIDELVKWGRLIRKTTPDGRAYLHAATLSKHTKMDTRWNTRCPYCALEGNAKPVSAPPSTDEPAETHASLSEPAETPPSEVKGSEGRGGEVKGGSSSLGALPHAEPDTESDNLGAFPASQPDGQVTDLESPAKVGPGSPGTPTASRPDEAPKSSGAKGTRIPDDFTVTEAMVAWAHQRAPNVNGRLETEKFVNYWRSLPGVKAKKIDWQLTWRNWMLTAQGDAERRSPRASPPTAHQTYRNPTDQSIYEGDL